MSIIFLISDFLYEDDMFETHVFRQISSRHDLIPIVISDPLETQLPDGNGFIRFRDLESGREKCVRLSKRNRMQYAESLREKKRELVGSFYRFGLDYQMIQTNQSFYELVMSLFLLRRRS